MANKINMEQDFKDWFKKLWRGTTSSGRQQLMDKNSQYSLIRIRHHGQGAFTEWLVVENFTTPPNSWGIPDNVWKKEGKLTKDDKAIIYERFKLNP